MTALTVVRQPMSALHLDPRNPRQHPDENIDAIAASLRRFGQQKPIVVRADGLIAAGNGTFIAARDRLDWTEIDTVISELPEAELAAFGIGDNQTALSSTWDDALLAKLLSEMPDTSGTGFDDTALADLLARVAEPPAALTDPDDVPEPPKVPVTKRGDLWLLGDGPNQHRIFCGDSTSKADIGRLVAGKPVDMVWTDPPYGVDVTGGTHDPRDKANYGKGKKVTNDAMSEEETERLWREVAGATASVSRAGAAWYTAAPPGPLHLRFARVLDDLGILRQQLIWVKSNFVFGRSDYHYRHEPIMYGWMPDGAHYFVDDRTQDTVLEFDRPERDLSHPTMKPVELVARCIRNSSKPGETILDPFGGSGTTLIAAHQEGRVARLCEISPEYVDVTIARAAAFTGLDPLRESDGALWSDLS